MRISKNILQKILPLTFLALYIAQISVAQKVVHYDLYITDTLVNYGGKQKHAIAANGQIPMPTLEFTQGDTAEIVVHNRLKENTALHWHGVHLPNEMDGVAYLTQEPIAPGSSYTYRFPITQNGTHHYHSHFGLQEQIGMYGMFIMHKRKDDPTFRKGIDDLPTAQMEISEWTNLNPHNVLRMLRKESDYFAIKKGSTQNYWEAIKKGYFTTKVTNEWKRMTAMDVSDIYYDAFLVNGQKESQLPEYKAGEKVRVRITNEGSSDYFWITYAGGKITVVASDGLDVEPVTVDRLLIGVSETYDIVLTIPENGSYELRATPEDRSGSASVFLGTGDRKAVTPLPKLKYFEGMKMMNNMMSMNGNMKDMGMKMSLQRMDMNAVMYPELGGQKMKMDMHGMDMKKSDENGSMKGMDMKADSGNKSHQMHGMKMNSGNNSHQMHGMKMDSANKDHQMHGMDMKMDGMDHSMHGNHPDSKIVTLNYGMLKSPTKTNFPENAPVREIQFELTGNMNRYVWSMNRKVLTEVDKIPVKKGEILRITLYNNSMMRHPMHLHGFDFRVLNGKGDDAPLKNVLDIMPMETDTIEFAANREGDWFFHCHILYHMMAGMDRVFDVGDYNNPAVPDKAKAYRKLQKENNMLFFSAQNDFATNGNDGELSLENIRWKLSSEWRLGYNDKSGYESETYLGRYIGKNQWFMPFIGFDWRYRKTNLSGHEKNVFGQEYTKDHRTAVSIGFNYTLPMLVVFQALTYHDGKVRLQLSREDIPLTARLRGEFAVNTDKEYRGGLRYILNRNMGIRGHYDSDMGWGIGLSLNY